MKSEDDYTAEENELVARITRMEDTIEDMAELEEETAELLKLGAITEAQVSTARRNMADAQSMLGISQRRLARMVEKRRSG